MKKIGLGIAILLFAIVFALSSSGMGVVTLAIGLIGLVCAIVGFIEKK